MSPRTSFWTLFRICLLSLVLFLDRSVWYRSSVRLLIISSLKFFVSEIWTWTDSLGWKSLTAGLSNFHCNHEVFMLQNASNEVLPGFALDYSTLNGLQYFKWKIISNMHDRSIHLFKMWKLLRVNYKSRGKIRIQIMFGKQKRWPKSLQWNQIRKSPQCKEGWN